jgi:hypothetical protein
MNPQLRQLLVVSTFAMATAAGAQPTSTTSQSTATTPNSAATTPATAPKTESMIQAEKDFEAAKTACQAERSKTARVDCLKRAQDAFYRANAVPGAPLGGVGGSASGAASGGGASSAKQRS